MDLDYYFWKMFQTNLSKATGDPEVLANEHFLFGALINLESKRF